MGVEVMMMKYVFNYGFHGNVGEESVVINADSDVEAVFIFFDRKGVVDFGCLRADGHFFTDDKFPKQKEMIQLGC